MKKFRMDSFPTDTPSSYPSPETEALFDAILSLRTKGEAAKFFRDLLTMTEITEFANRWHMVRLLQKGNSYSTIAQKLKTSTTTVTRVAHWFRNGMGGYLLVANRVLGKPMESPKHRPFRLRGKRTFV